MTTTTHLRTIALRWTDLRDALATTGTATWPPAGRMTDYLASIDRADAEALDEERRRALALRTLERDPAQIGETRAPLRISVLDTMREVQDAMVTCADQIAGSVQRPVMGPLPATYPAADRRRREIMVMQDRADPRRWSWTRGRADAPYAAVWLLARVQGAPGPFRPLTPVQADHIASVAKTQAGRVTKTLGIAAQKARLADACPACGGRIDMHGGAGAHPVAHCTGCGRIWADGVTAA